MFINYEHNNHVYNVSAEKRKDHFFITYDNTEYRVEAEELKPGQLKMKIGDRIVKAVITEGNKEKLPPYVKPIKQVPMIIKNNSVWNGKRIIAILSKMNIITIVIVLPILSEIPPQVILPKPLKKAKIPPIVVPIKAISDELSSMTSCS